MRSTLLAAFSLPLLANVATAQVTLALQSPTGVTATAVSGSNTSTLVGPVGILPMLGSVDVQVGSFDCQAGTSWEVTPYVTDFRTRIEQSVYVAPGLSGPTSAISDTGDLRLEFAAAGATPAQFSCQITVLADAGNPTPLVEVDVGADGVIDFTQNTFPGGIVPAAFGVTPTPVIVRVRSSLTTPGLTRVYVTLDAVPSNNLVIDQVIGGCATRNLLVEPTFTGQGVAIFAGGVPFHPTVIVLGLNTSLLQLPAIGGLPCLLLPSPDLLVARLTYEPYELPIPAAARPISFWAQGVAVQPNALVTTPGYRVQAF
ncbi:MAG TPA: hypothetical protein VFZ65_06080 [Planctomycetota bacterium]|nr:hypothetical protein [Planctomycetota bacterium]